MDRYVKLLVKEENSIMKRSMAVRRAGGILLSIMMVFSLMPLGQIAYAADEYGVALNDLDLGSAIEGYSSSERERNMTLTKSGTAVMESGTDHIWIELTGGDTDAFIVEKKNTGSMTGSGTYIGAGVSPKAGLSAGEYSATATLWYDRDGSGATYGPQALDTASVTFIVKAKEYAIMVNGGFANKTRAAAGETIEIRANRPNTGMRFDRWASDQVVFDSAESAETKFIMPSSDVTVTAKFVSTYPFDDDTIVEIPKVGVRSNISSILVLGGEIKRMDYMLEQGGPAHFNDIMGYWEKETDGSWNKCMEGCFDVGNWRYVGYVRCNNQGYELAENLEVVVDGVNWNAGEPTYGVDSNDYYYSYVWVTSPVFTLSDAPVYHTVSFDTGGGTAIGAQTILDGGTVERPDDPVKEGYRFRCWCSNPELSILYYFDNEVKEDLTLYAVWEKEVVTPDKYYLELINCKAKEWYQKNGVWIPVEETEAGTEIQLTADKSSTQIFSKWIFSRAVEYTKPMYDDDDTTTYIKMPEGNLTVRATYMDVFSEQPSGGFAVAGDEFIAKWKLNKDTASDKIGIYLVDEENNRTWNGWGKMERAVISGKGKTPGTTETYCISIDYDNNDYFSENFDVTWTEPEPDYYYVTYDANGGSGTMETDVVKIPYNSTTLPLCTFTPPSENQKFEKWDAGYPGESIEVTGDRVVRAIWIDKIQPAFKTQPNGGTVENGGSIYVNWALDPVPDIVQIQQYHPDTNEWEFYCGASVGPVGHVTFDNQYNVSRTYRVAAYYNEEGISIYSREFTINWIDVIVPHTISFDANGHGTAPASKNIDDGRIAAKPDDLVESGWTFTGWYLDRDCTTKFDFNTPITSDITLYAGWLKNHEHSWTYTASGNQITASCSCGEEHYLTLYRAELEYWEGPCVLSYTDDISPVTGVYPGTLEYAKKGSSDYSVTPIEVGEYTGRITLGGATAYADLIILEKPYEFPFTDVNTGDWFYDDVDYAYRNGLMNGTGDKIFSPGLTTTRGMIVTILYRLEGKPDVYTDCPFGDVKAGSYYEAAITWAAANGIVNGFSPEKFGPDDNITREQMAAILYRYAAFKKYDVSARADLSRYTDSDTISSYALDYISWANAKGLINGMSDTTLEPKGEATRAQVAAILHRFCVMIAG